MGINVGKKKQTFNRTLKDAVESLHLLCYNIVMLTNEQPLIAVQDICHAAPGNVLLENISFHVNRGEFFTILGPSGSGKTTLLKVIAGVAKPSHGRIFIRGKDVTELPGRKRNLSMVFQNYSLFPHMTVGRNIGFPLKMSGIQKKQRWRKVRKKAEDINMHIGDRLNALPDLLSMGQQQRTALARSTIKQKDILLLDEPMSELDARQREMARKSLKKLVRELEVTVVYVTNNEREAFALSDRVLILDKGRIVQIGAPSEIYKQPVSLFAARFFGTPEMNYVPARQQLGDSIFEGGIKIPVVPAAALSYVLGVRPEALSAKPEGEGMFRAKVILREILHPGKAIIHIDKPENWKYIDKSSKPPARGEIVELGVDKDKVLFFEEGTGRRIE